VTDGFVFATVSVPQLFVVTHEIGPASAITLTCPAALPVALPNGDTVAMPLFGDTRHVTVGVPLPPLPPEPELRLNWSGSRMLNASSVDRPPWPAPLSCPPAT